MKINLPSDFNIRIWTFLDKPTYRESWKLPHTEKKGIRCPVMCNDVLGMTVRAHDLSTFCPARLLTGPFSQPAPTRVSRQRKAHILAKAGTPVADLSPKGEKGNLNGGFFLSYMCSCNINEFRSQEGSYRVQALKI